MSLENINTFIKNALDFIKSKDYIKAKESVAKAYDIAKHSDNYPFVSICMSLNYFLNFSINGADESDTLEEAAFLANKYENNSALQINELIKGNINFYENNKEVALIHYNNALKLASQNDEYSLSDLINTRIKQLQNGMDYSLPTQTDPLVSLV